MNPPGGPGKLVKKFGLSASRVREIVLLSGLSAGMSLVCWLPAIFEANESPGTRLGISLLGFFISLPMFFGIWQLFRMAGVSLELYEHGLIYRQPGREFMTTWKEIVALSGTRTCRITRQDGRQVEFGAGIEGFEEAAGTIRRACLRHLLPGSLEALRGGSSVTFKGLLPFGKSRLGQRLNNSMAASAGFSTDAQGIRSLEDENKAIPWSQVRQYGTRSEALGRLPVEVFFIESAQVELKTRLELLSNVQLLSKLCGEMTGLEEEDG